MGTDDFETISYERDGRVATLRLERPDRKNALSEQLSNELVAATEDFDDDETASVLVVTGTGDAFSAGADIGELQDRLTAQLDPNSTVEDALTYDPLDLPSQAVAGTSKPVIALIDGFCLGGGIELALACDIRLASERSTFGTPEVSLGKFPGDGGTQRLPREIGTGDAMFLILTGEPISAERARELGIVQAVYPDDTFEADAMDVVDTIADHPIPTLILAKRVVNLADKTELQAGLELEVLLDNLLELTPARREQLAEFLGE
jgi:enoyl-CoA hydratase/carnithine racemase